MQKQISSLFWIVSLALAAFNNNVFVNAQDENDDFFQACQDGDMESVKEMIEESPDLVNIFSNDGETCLMLSAVESNMEMVQFLIKSGADINERAIGTDNHRMPVLGWHILAGNHEIVDYLIAHGVELNQEFDGVDEEGNMFGIFTALDLVDFLLHQINEEEHPEIVERYAATRDVLVEHGARIFVGGMEF